MEDVGKMTNNEAMRKLRKHGFKGGLEKRDKFGDTPLTGAARSGREEMALLLVQAGANVNRPLPDIRSIAKSASHLLAVYKKLFEKLLLSGKVPSTMSESSPLVVAASDGKGGS
uniref:Uncharacterized protein n=1 Tax=Hemiselmis andersenii TaxID=464988 RepID=A0A6U4X7P5_HEMAN|mmetsp:Transcript_40192/g.94097  ORF Transcript_40192/g.94097 Transcript_40192/m.94097 type:complete len:114 (+) Transcript_40192:376-717(+)